WKNLMSKTIERIKKPLLAIGLTGTLIASLAACSVGAPINPDKTNEPSPTPDTVACSTENPGPWGDVIAKDSVTDEFGEYCHTTIDPNSGAFKYDATKVDMAALETHGFTEEDAKATQ